MLAHARIAVILFLLAVTVGGCAADVYDEPYPGPYTVYDSGYRVYDGPYYSYYGRYAGPGWYPYGSFPGFDYRYRAYPRWGLHERGWYGRPGWHGGHGFHGHGGRGGPHGRSR